MTHEAGIEAAVEMYRDTYTDIGGTPHEKTVEAMIKAYLSASGMVLVPRTATKEMIVVGNETIEECIDSWNYDSGAGYSVEQRAANQTFEAMIAASPNPFKSKP